MTNHTKELEKKVEIYTNNFDISNFKIAEMKEIVEIKMLLKQ